jgi:Met-zincin/Domain of unknown function (DUF5117)
MKKLFFGCLLLSQFCFAQKLPGIEEKTTGLKKMEGFFPLYWDENSGKLWLEINRIDTEILYVISLPAGLGSNDIGLDRGLLGGGRIVKFSKVGRKLLMVEPNYGYRAITTDENEKKAVEQSFAQSVLWGFTIEAETGNRILVDATDFLTRDAMQAANRIRRLQQGSYSLDKTRSAIYPTATKNFPLNTELEATITLVNSDGITGNYVQAVTPSTEAITLRIHHSFVQLPDNNYKPRVFDPRSSFIPVSFFDYSTPVAEPIEKYYVIRHRLQKKDPESALSEPVKPIIYYLDNGTPEPIRSALLKGASWWNQAFEAAGYKNAFQVKLLPDSADPMDIRYNMINWVHRSTRGWSYGASVVDPRTGEIIKGQVSLGSLRVRQDYLIAQGLLSPFAQGLSANDPMLKMALARLEQLSAHEVGHTIGLMHNYASSMNNRASVMDYPHPMVRLNSKGEMDFSQVYDDKIGDWDKLAVTWGYQDFPKNTSESAGLNKILSDGIAKGLLFISDRDARAPGGAHPKAHLWDNGNDAAIELLDVLKVRSKALEQFGLNTIRQGMPSAMLEDALVPVYLYHRYQVEAAVKLIGGVDYTYSLRGDGQPAVKMVDKATQLKALDALLESVSPANLMLPSRITSLIPPRPAGYEYSRELFKKRTGLIFDNLSPAETAADLPMSFIFHPERLSRLAQQEMAGGLGITEMVNRIFAATWKSPRQSGMAKLIQQQTEQIILTYLLASSVDEQSSFAARSAVQKSLADLKTFIEGKNKTNTDNVYGGHLALALERMKAPEKAKPTQHAVAPPGAPIGCW